MEVEIFWQPYRLEHGGMSLQVVYVWRDQGVAPGYWLKSSLFLEPHYFDTRSVELGRTYSVLDLIAEVAEERVKAARCLAAMPFGLYQFAGNLKH